MPAGPALPSGFGGPPTGEQALLDRPTLPATTLRPGETDPATIRRGGPLPRRSSRGSTPPTGSMSWLDADSTPAAGAPVQDGEPAQPDAGATTTLPTTTLPATLRRSRRAERRNERAAEPGQASDQRAADQRRDEHVDRDRDGRAGPDDGHEPEQPVDHGRVGRNLPAAIAVGVGLAALALVSLFTRPEAFVVLASLVVVLAVWELSGALAAKQVVVPVVPVAVGSIGMLVSSYVAGAQGLVVSFALTGFGILLWRIIDGVEGALRDVTAGLFAAAYVPLLAGFAVLLLADDHGPQRVVTFILVTVSSDIGGYIAGVIAGKHPMAPVISPKKSWEGFAGSVFFCLVAGAGSVILLLDGRWWVGLLLGAAAAVTATLGDLSESLLKRDLKIKDMGNLLPGHGGIMDRLDSLLPTAPVAYLLLHFLIK